jgi:hypothetical protein
MLPRYFGGLRMGKFKRKLRNSKKGVSEIIANILILAITVTLFSSIMIYVGQMPSPQKNAYADFTPSTRFLTSSNQIELNMTHKGGQELISNDTGFYIFVNDTKTTLMPGDIIGSVGDRWSIGEVFSYNIYIDPVANPNIHKVRLSVMITDKEKNSLVYSASVLGGTPSANTPPIMGARGTTPSPTYENASFSFYIQITDPDNDLDTSSVKIDLTSIGKGASVQMNDVNNDGIFTAGPYVADLHWNGEVVVVSCSDAFGNSAFGQITMTILQLSTNNYYYTTGGGGEAEPPQNINMSGFQGFNIFEWSDWEAHKFNSTPDREFTYGESAVVVVISKFLANLDQENVLQVMDQTTKNVIPSVSSPANIFVKYKVMSGYYIYNITIDTELLANHAYYTVQMHLRDSSVPNNMFFASDTIKVGSPSAYPIFKTYKDAGFTQESNEFNTTDIIYVKIMNKYGGSWYQYGGDVEIRDFFWNAQVKKTPPTGGSGATTWNGAVSNVWNLAAPSNEYRFEIDLQNATDGATWIPGRNVYDFRYDMFKAGSETYLLNKLVYITAPKWKADIVVGGLLQNGGRYASPASILFYKNDNQWSPPDLLETSSDKAYYDPDVILVRTGDIDQDGKSDIVAVRYVTKGGSGYYLAWYKNTGTEWIKYEIATLGAAPSTMAIGNIDLDNDLDIVIGYKGGYLNNAVWLYRNDGSWSNQKIGELAGSGNSDPSVTALQVVDMDAKGTPGNDAYRSLDVVAGRANGIVTVYRNALGTGTTWNPASVSSTTADIFDYANADIPVSGTVNGTYTQTANPYQDDGVYQQISEELIHTYAGINPTAKGANDTGIPDLIKDLQYGDPDNPYTVEFGDIAEVKEWDSSNLFDFYPNYTVTFNVKVRTTGYSGGDIIKWWSNNGGWAPHDILTINDTAGVYQEYQVNITNDVMTLLGNKPTNLQYLLVSFANTKGGNVDFDYWTINVTYTTGDKLEHIWTVNLRTGTSHTFEVYSYRSTIKDGDALLFAYSTDNVTYHDMLSVNAITLPMVKYTFTLPLALSGKVYIKVYDTVRSTPTPKLDWIRVGQMTIRTVASVSVLGTKVLAMDVSDINKDGSNDLIIVTLTEKPTLGHIYVGLNQAGDVFTTMSEIVAANANYKDVNSAAAGKFFDSSSKARLDIMVSTPSMVYMLRYNAGSYTENYKTIIGTGIVRTMASDVDNNGYTDLIVITSSLITLYSNNAGTPTGWKTYLIDNIASTTTIRDCDVGRLQTS